MRHEKSLERKARPEDRERDQQTRNRRSEGHAKNKSEKERRERALHAADFDAEVGFYEHENAHADDAKRRDSVQVEDGAGGEVFADALG